MSRILLLALAVWPWCAAPTAAQTVLTLDDVLARARTRAGAVTVARARVAEVEAGTVDAALRLRENPVIEVAAGPRSGAAGPSTAFEIGAFQQFENGGRRAARVAGAAAATDRARADADEIVRHTAFEAALAFVEGIAARERLHLAEEADAVSRDLLAATERRHALGDIAAIDLNLARIEAARTGAALRAARAELTAAVGTLRAVLQIAAAEPIELRGTLELPPPPSIEELRPALLARSDLAAMRAEVREAEAEIQMARALGRADLGVRVAYEREDASNVVLGGLTVALPAFQRGQGLLAAGSARASRARIELEMRAERAEAELDSAYAAYSQRVDAADTLAREALPNVADNEALARRSYEAGELNLMEMLLLRRDALDTRMTLIDRRLDAARSRLKVDFLSGGSR